MTDYSWADIREQLKHDIQVWYVKNEETNRKREKDKEKTIDWIIEMMKEGPVRGGMIGDKPGYAYTFGNLWGPLTKAMRMRYPMCQICGRKPTEEVHHIRPKCQCLKGARENPRNLICLCKECHDEVHRKIDEGIIKAIMESYDWHKVTNQKPMDDGV